jgi:hypothetical protein
MRLPPDAIFRYVRLERLDEFMVLGWLPASELGPVHGYYSILAAWICECPARMPS